MIGGKMATVDGIADIDIQDEEMVRLRKAADKIRDHLRQGEHEVAFRYLYGDIKLGSSLSFNDAQTLLKHPGFQKYHRELQDLLDEAMYSFS